MVRVREPRSYYIIADRNKETVGSQPGVTEDDDVFTCREMFGVFLSFFSGSSEKNLTTQNL